MERGLRVVACLCLIPVLTSRPLAAQEKTNRLVLTLEQCEELALSGNPNIQDAELGIAVAEAREHQAATAKYLPRFELRNLWGPSQKAEGIVDPVTGFVTSPDTSFAGSDLRYFTQLDIDLVQPLFTFGRLSSLADAARFGVDAEEARLDAERNTVRFQVRQLYWSLVLGEELLALIRDADAELTKAETQVEEKLDAGSDEVTQDDLFKLQIFRYDVNKRLRDAEDKLALAAAALRAALGIADDVVIEPAVDFLDPLDIAVDSFDVYWQEAQRSRPELARLQAGVQASAALLRVERSNYYPQLFLGGQIKYNFAKDRFDPRNPFLYNPTNYFRPGLALGVNMNLNFWQTRASVRVAEANYQQVAQKVDQANEGLRLEVQKSYLALRQAQSNLEDSRRAARAGDNWLRSATMTFDIGVGEVKDLIDAFRANSAIQAEHLQNIFSFNVAAAELSKVIGRDIYPSQ